MMASGSAAFVPVLVLLLIVGSDLWVYQDARARAERGDPVVFATDFLRVDTPLAWLLLCLILWVVFFPLYVTLRNKAR